MVKTGSLSVECSSSIEEPAGKMRALAKPQRTVRGASAGHDSPSYAQKSLPTGRDSGEAAQPGRNSGAEGATVLFVSDDDYFRSTMRAYLEHVGFKVRSSADAARIPELFFRQPGAGAAVDLLLIDVHALGSTGLRLAAELTCFVPDLPVVIITSPGMDEGELSGIVRQGWKFLNKPVLLPQLLGVILSALEPRPGGTSGSFPRPEQGIVQ